MAETYTFNQNGELVSGNVNYAVSFAKKTAEYTGDSFSLRIITMIKSMMEFNPLFPIETGEMLQKSLTRNPVVPVGLKTHYFELGSEEAERDVPYYHILEDAQVIHKKGRGTKSSKGSQARIADPSLRDYGQWTTRFNKDGSKVNSSQEYRKNLRGSRSKVIDGKTKATTYYVNKHYQYIERILNIITPVVAARLNMRLVKSMSEGNGEWGSNLI